jgi:hypothetical protein
MVVVFFNVYLSDLITNSCLQVGCNKHSEVIQPPVKYVGLSDVNMNKRKALLVGVLTYVRSSA